MVQFIAHGREVFCASLFSPEEEEFFDVAGIFGTRPPDGDKEEVNRKGNSNLSPEGLEDAKGTGSLFSRRSLAEGTFNAREAEESKASDRRLSN